MKLLKSELKQRGVEGIIHFHQFACHHKLEDPILREALCAEGYPFITIEADLPSKTPQQTRLRIEAFKERLGDL
ncbi:MAG TPA: 2-hydroxyacyl-CoA dehydratase [Euryarchaeota archaeon]|nr:2-hydroxyacyl-CoA dehydratase [Euryarchaeota archaeon]